MKILLSKPSQSNDRLPAVSGFLISALLHGGIGAFFIVANPFEVVKPAEIKAMKINLNAFEAP